MLAIMNALFVKQSCSPLNTNTNPPQGWPLFGTI